MRRASLIEDCRDSRLCGPAKRVVAEIVGVTVGVSELWTSTLRQGAHYSKDRFRPPDALANI